MIWVLGPSGEATDPVGFYYMRVYIHTYFSFLGSFFWQGGMLRGGMITACFPDAAYELSCGEFASESPGLK